jgi:hypothetical protein
MTRALAVAVAVAAALLVAGCDIDGDAGRVRAQQRSVAAFERIAVDGRADVSVRQGARHALTLRGGERLLDEVSTTVAGGALTIDRDGHVGAPLEATITLPRLRGLDADSAGEIKLLDIEANKLELRHDGAGTVRARGRVGTLSARLGGVGELELTELSAERAAVRVSGIGHAEVHVTGELDAAVTGVGDIVYHGDPLVRADVTGLGDVRAAR